MTEFKCPSCDQTGNFTAYAMLVEGAVDIDEDGYEPRWGKGLNFSIPDDALMRCPLCEYEARARDFH